MKAFIVDRYGKKDQGRIGELQDPEADRVSQSQKRAKSSHPPPISKPSSSS
jgi:hypothetical protein